jgi:hypothetical protein
VVGETLATVITLPVLSGVVGAAVRFNVTVLPASLAPVIDVSPTVPAPDAARPLVGSEYVKLVVVGMDAMV